MKTYRTLGIIAEDNSEGLDYSRQLNKKLDYEDDASTREGTPQGSRAVDGNEFGIMSNFPMQHQSLVGENAIVFRLKNNCSA